MIDIALLEKELTGYIAGILGRTVDVDIFRGGIPPGRDGVAVMIGGQITEAMYHAGANVPTFNVQVIGQFADSSTARDDAWHVLSALGSAVPVYGVRDVSFVYVAFEQRGDAAGPYAATDNGVMVWQISWNGTMAVMKK